MAQTFRQRIAQAEALARADMLRFQPEVLYSHLSLRFLNCTLRIKKKLMINAIKWYVSEF